MKTWQVAMTAPTVEELASAADVLRRGGLVAFPTETVYGLGANAWDEQAVQRVFRAKGRPADNPLIVHIADPADLALVASPSPAVATVVQMAIRQFWPGPLTLILPANPRLAPSVHPGTGAVGVRCPDHPVARALIRLAGCPVAAPSANRSGRPSPTTASDVAEDLADEIDGLIDGGPCTIGVESTVVELFADKAIIYRPGGVSPAQLEAALGIPVELDAHLTSRSSAPEDTTAGSAMHPAATSPKAPGMKYRHYAPDAQVHAWWGDEAAVRSAMLAFVTRHAGEAIAVIAPTSLPGAAYEWSPSPAEAYDTALSRELYRLLRAFDRCGVQHILVSGVQPDAGLGMAIMNRLEKATEGRLHSV